MKKLLVISLVLALCMTGVVASAAAPTIEASFQDGVVSVDVETSDQQAVILVLEGEKAAGYIDTADIAALENEIVYVDQAATTEGKASFKFLPNENFNAEDGAVVTIYASSTAADAVSMQTLNLVEYTVTYDANGGTLPGNTPSSFKVSPGSSVVLATPTRIGYEFLGWYSGENLVSSTMTVSDNVTLVAKWDAILTVAEKGEGYYGGTYTDNGTTYGVLSVTAKVGESVDEVTGYGFVFSAGDTDLELSPVNEVDMEALKKDGFFTIVYKIEEAYFGTDITFKPYIVVGANDAYTWGQIVTTKVNEFLDSDLGTAEELGFPEADQVTPAA